MKDKHVRVSESMWRELEIWRKAYSFGHKWQVEKALRYAYCHPEEVFNVKENNFLKEK